MRSTTTPRFRALFQALPEPIRILARKSYRLWQSNPRHPSLQFKKVGPFWSIRISADYRALALVRAGVYHWFWIGPHAGYEQILKGR